MRKLTIMKNMVFIMLLVFYSCSTYKDEIAVANCILNDQKHVSKEIDLINKASSEMDNFLEFDSYIKYKEFYETELKFKGIDFTFEKGYNFIFTNTDIKFIKNSIKKEFSWVDKIKNSKEEETKYIMNSITKDRYLLYLSKPYFNMSKNKAIVAFYCFGGNYESLFLVKENNKWRIIGNYKFEMQ